MRTTRTYYRLGEADRVVAYTPPAAPTTSHPAPPTTTSRVHPRILAAALELADGDPSRLVFVSPTQVDVLAAPRGGAR